MKRGETYAMSDCYQCDIIVSARSVTWGEGGGG